MKKFTSLSFLLIAALLVFSSCSKDDENKPSLDLTLLEGTWTVQKIDISSAGVTETMEDGETTYEFKSDKTYIETYFGSEEEGTYSVSGNKITLTSDSETIEYEVKELTASKLTVYTSEKMEIMGQEIELSETSYLTK